jgi:hypothetical protein
VHKGDKKGNNNNNNNNKDPIMMIDEKQIFSADYKVGNRIKNALPSLNIINSFHFIL